MNVNNTDKMEDISQNNMEEQELAKEKEIEDKEEDINQEIKEEMVKENVETLKSQDVKALIIPAKNINKKPLWVAQFELVRHGQGLLLCETYYDQKCIWQEDKGCLKLYIPQRQVHARSNEWYVYPAARLFVGESPLYMNLSLNPKLRSTFSARDIKLENNYLHVKYKQQRQKGVVMPAGMLLGSLYISEPWEKRPTNYKTPVPMYDVKYAR